MKILFVFSSKPSCARKYAILVQFEMQSVSLSNARFSSSGHWWHWLMAAVVYHPRATGRRCGILAAQTAFSPNTGEKTERHGEAVPQGCITSQQPRLLSPNNRDCQVVTMHLMGSVREGAFRDSRARQWLPMTDSPTPLSRYFDAVALEFDKNLSVELSKNLRLPSVGKDGIRHRNRPGRMSESEIMTVLVCYHFGTYRTFKDYYLNYIRGGA